nr:hypothetical protein 18 [bacterium]
MPVAVVAVADMGMLMIQRVMLMLMGMPTARSFLQPILLPGVVTMVMVWILISAAVAVAVVVA